MTDTQIILAIACGCAVVWLVVLGWVVWSIKKINLSLYHLSWDTDALWECVNKLLGRYEAEHSHH